jgi:hypothetical protein
LVGVGGGGRSPEAEEGGGGGGQEADRSYAYGQLVSVGECLGVFALCDGSGQQPAGPIVHAAATDYRK